jgi:hypothetical protein
VGAPCARRPCGVEAMARLWCHSPVGHTRPGHLLGGLCAAPLSRRARAGQRRASPAERKQAARRLTRWSCLVLGERQEALLVRLGAADAGGNRARVAECSVGTMGDAPDPSAMGVWHVRFFRYALGRLTLRFSLPHDHSEGTIKIYQASIVSL